MKTATNHLASSDRARNGKIARLPESIRAELNQRLRDGHTSCLILPWLNSLPEVQRILAQFFSSKPITKSNLSAWRQGGFAADTLEKLQTERLKQMTAFAFKLGTVGRRCSAALTSRPHSASAGPTSPAGRRRSDAQTSPLAQGALILATAKLFELLQSPGGPDFDQLNQIIKSLTAIRRTEISQQNTRLREKHLQLREKSNHPIRQSKRIPDDSEYQVPEPTEPDIYRPFTPDPPTTSPDGARTFLSASETPPSTPEKTTPSVETQKSESSPVKVNEAQPQPQPEPPKTRPSRDYLFEPQPFIYINPLNCQTT